MTEKKGAKSTPNTVDIIPQTQAETQLKKYFDMGWKLVPLRRPNGRLTGGRIAQGKEPIPRGWQDNPLKNMEEAEKYLKNNCNFGVVCGERSEIVVIDVDSPKHPEAGAWIAGLQADGVLPSTRVHRTGSGGYHYFFNFIEGFKNRNGVGVEGIDIKTTGGQVVLPPYSNTKGRYTVVSSEPVADMPKKLIEILAEKGYMGGGGKTKAPTTTTKTENKTPDKTTRYGQGALKNMQKKLQDTPEGKRNDTLNSVAYSAGQLVAGGEIVPEDAREILKKAAELSGLDDAEINKTLEHSLRDGINSGRPKSAPQNEQNEPQTMRPHQVKAFLASKGLNFRLNTLTDAIEKDGQKLTDVELAKVNNICRNSGIKGMAMVADVVTEMADDNRYHPVQAHFEGLPNTTGAIKNMGCFFELKNKTYPNAFKDFLRKFLIGAVHRVFTGVQNITLIIEGAQGIGKSRFAKWICPRLLNDSGSAKQLFCYSAVNPESKDDLLKMISALIWEVPEFGHTARRSDREALKAFFTTEMIQVRKPYGRFPICKPAMASFIATINNEQGFLTDPTGNRRYVTLAVAQIDTAFEKLNPDDLWGEAYHAWRAGERGFLDKKYEAQRDFLNQEYEVEIAVMPYLLKILTFTGNEDDFVPTVDLQQMVLSQGYKVQTIRILDLEISNSMKKLGIEKTRKRLEYTVHPTRGYSGVRIDWKL